jgi:hypothetical protein
MNIAAFWEIAPCSLTEIDRRFRGENVKPHGEFIDWKSDYKLSNNKGVTAWSLSSGISYFPLIL